MESGGSGVTDEGTTEHPTGRRWHAGRWVLVGLFVVVVVGAGVVGARYVFRDRPDPKSVDAAVDDYRRGSAPTSSAGASVRLPAAGVYELSGSGRETISFPPNSQDDGATMPGSVERLPGNCFRWRVDYNEAHWHQWDFCRDGEDLLLGTQKNSQRWDFGSIKVENVGDFLCDPPQRYPIGAPTGTVTTGTCSGTNTAVPGTSQTDDRTEVIGPEKLRIGSATVAAVHLRQSDTLTGAQTGDNTVDWWFDPRTGLPLRAVRSYRLDTASPVGTITYTEEGQWQLTDLEPRQ